MSAIPEFAVVGHPNKGKSSIVATLAGDDSVAIGPEPGTTIRCRRYPLTVDGRVLYALIDTPGFQRARKALAWLREHAATPAERPAAVRMFVADPQMQREFPDETELLRPIMDGAAVLYVVDGSVPYNQEYEAELEILQWTGQPRMALINPITTTAYVEQWSAALGQYFSLVRVFNAVHAEFARQVDLLRAFGELHQPWRDSLTTGVDLLVNARRSRIGRVAQAIGDSIAEMLEYRTEVKIPRDSANIEVFRQKATEELYSGLRDIESLSRKRVETICAYHNLERSEPTLPVLDPSQLFSNESWRVFGLTQTEVLSYATAGGALIGSGIDAATGGASMLAGTIIGGIVGFSSAYFSAGKLVDATVLSLPLGARVVAAGPVRAIEFPHLVFNRARLHYRILAFRTHARRDTLDLGSLDLNSAAEYGVGVGLTPLGASEKKRLEWSFSKLRGSSESSPHGKVRQNLAAVVEDILLRDEKLASK